MGGGQICVSTDGNKTYTWIQCSECGRVYQIAGQTSEEDLYVVAYCTECESRIGINLGCDKNDIYLYMNPNLDRRMF